MQRRLLTMIAIAWLVAIACGFWRVYAYATTEGLHAMAPRTWPASSALERNPNGFTIIMFVHPDCPCSRASLAELGAIDARPRTIIVAVDHAIDIGVVPGAIERIDTGVEARRFGAQTSGHVVVYDRLGVLRFSGGITGSRGHRGDNVGRRAVEHLLANRRAPAQHAVFGCALLDEASP